MIINKKEKTIAFYLLLASIAVFAGHFFILKAFPQCPDIPNVLWIHPFLFLITIITIIASKIIIKKWKPNILAYAFLICSFFKMLLSVLFLMSVIKNNSNYQIAYITQFFILYFFYLIFEILYFMRLLKNIKENHI